MKYSRESHSLNLHIHHPVLFLHSGFELGEDIVQRLAGVAGHQPLDLPDLPLYVLVFNRCHLCNRSIFSLVVAIISSIRVIRCSERNWLSV